MIKRLKQWLLGRGKLFTSLLPNYRAFYQKGYRAQVIAHEFCLTKDYGPFVLTVHLGIEPHHPHYHSLIDFSVPGPCVVIKLQEGRELAGDRRGLAACCDEIHQRPGGYYFLLFHDPRFDEDKIIRAIELIEHYTDS